jgi:stage II sporulation protein P
MLKRSLTQSGIFVKVMFMLVIMGCCAACSGCKSEVSPDSATPTALDESSAPVLLETEPPEPTASPTPEPEMVIDEDGDITLRSDIEAAFSTTSYTFAEAPTVLIYHTHATESYLKSDTDDYLETETGRTENNAYNVIAVGDALASALEERGFLVIHDTTNVEPPELISAYSRSLEVMRQYDDIDIYLDLHRNASRQRGRSDNTVYIGDTPCAKLFFVVGTGIGTYEGEYDVLPEWEGNYTFALSVMDAIEDDAQPLVKPIRLKVGRYNQHMGLCLLAEIGTNADTLSAALNTVPYLADALADVCVFESTTPGR